MAENKIIYLEEDKVKLILADNKGKIGKSKYADADRIVTAIAFWVPMVLADFSKWNTVGLIVQTILIMLGIIYMIYGIYKTVQNIRNKFDEKELYNQLKEANLMVEHPHSIVLIKDTFNNNSNRYLMYYDSRWECKLFLNYATYVDDYDKNDKNIREHLRMELKVPGGDIEGAFLFEEVHEKYSASAKKQKCYRHRFYKYRIDEFAEELRKNDFEIEGKHFYWMSIAEMERDPRIMEVNSDIVAMVKAHE